MYLKNTLDFGHSQRLSLVILVSWDFELNLPGLYWELWTVNKVAPDSAAEAPPPHCSTLPWFCFSGIFLGSSPAQ